MSGSSVDFPPQYYPFPRTAIKHQSYLTVWVLCESYWLLLIAYRAIDSAILPVETLRPTPIDSAFFFTPEYFNAS